MDSNVQWRLLAIELARMPGAAQRLLAVHMEDGSGRCRVCSSGRQAGRYVWPCQLHLLATRAVEIQDGARPEAEHAKVDRRRRYGTVPPTAVVEPSAHTTSPVRPTRCPSQDAASGPRA